MSKVRWHTTSSLIDAYAIAGSRFGPEISHHFVILEMDKAIQMERGRKQKKNKKK